MCRKAGRLSNVLLEPVLLIVIPVVALPSVTVAVMPCTHGPDKPPLPPICGQTCVCPGSVIVWLCAGSWPAVDSDWLSVPPVPPGLVDAGAPRGNVPRKFGTLNVVEPSPAPKLVPIAAKSAAYVDRDIADPSHITHPVGRALYAPPHIPPVPGSITVGDDGGEVMNIVMSLSSSPCVGKQVGCQMYCLSVCC